MFPRSFLIPSFRKGGLGRIYVFLSFQELSALLSLLTAKNTPASISPAAAAIIPHSERVGIGCVEPDIKPVPLNCVTSPRSSASPVGLFTSGPLARDVMSGNNSVASNTTELPIHAIVDPEIHQQISVRGIELQKRDYKYETRKLVMILHMRSSMFPRSFLIPSFRKGGLGRIYVFLSFQELSALLFLLTAKNTPTIKSPAAAAIIPHSERVGI